MVEVEQKRYADDITLQELVRLRVENERLREEIKAQKLALNHAGDAAFEMLKQANEIERLQEANETIVVLNEQANNEVYWLEQEIERLRGALERCADLSEKWQDSLVSQINLIARSALQQKESE